jgi:hypothetical protein
MISLLFSLSSLWTASRENASLSANGGASTYLGFRHLQAQGRGGGANRLENGPGQPAWADPPRPISAWFGHPFTHVGPLDILHFTPSNCTILTMTSSRPRWRVFSHEVRSFTLQSSGDVPCNTSVHATFGSDFIMLSNTNGTPQLLL